MKAEQLAELLMKHKGCDIKISIGIKKKRLFGKKKNNTYNGVSKILDESDIYYGPGTLDFSLFIDK